MKTPITGSVNEKGLFTAKNPYVKLGTGNPQDYLYAEFENDHPQLLTYTPSNVLVTDEEHVEVVKQWQWKNDREQWLDVEPGQILKSDIDTRQVYITIPPTEKESPYMHTLSELQAQVERLENITGEYLDEEQLSIGLNYYKNMIRHKNYRPEPSSAESNTGIPEAQPFEGVKTAEIEQAAEVYLNKCDSIDGHSPYYGFIAGANWMKENARATTDKSSVVQFATDAGGGKELLTDCQEMLMNLIALNLVPDEACPYMNDMISRIDDALLAPYTHSSSEMVEVEKVVSVIKGWWYSPNRNNKDILIRQISKINEGNI